MNEVETLKCSCGHEYKTRSRSNNKDWGTPEGRADFTCAQCKKVTTIKGQFVVCQSCEAYVPYCTKLCPCGYKRCLTRGEAKVVLGKVEPDMKAYTRTNSSARTGVAKSPFTGAVAAFKPDSGELGRPGDHEE